MKKIPELLAPAGSPEALHAAIKGGADAVYFGGELFSNRMRAKNFSEEELENAILLCASHGVSSYITMNTRLRDRECAEAYALARRLYEAGATAFITADLGLAAYVRENLPGIELHASTQMTGENSLDAAALAELGFCRMVCPRELSMGELERLVKESPIEIEAFVHGAHCVSVSGQCLMSWAMGGRSGNRGECAQPCRLPYRVAGGCGKGGASCHPLSLKDMCLGAHIPELIDSGVASLKIEGRLKSADYVYGVVKTYRRLLDEGRGATPDEIRYLDGIFSRDGFTDGYFTSRHRGMTGMRSEDAVSSGEKFEGLTKKIKISAHAELEVGSPARLTVSDGISEVTSVGDVVSEAKTAPLSEETVFKNIAKLGGTPCSLDRRDFKCTLKGDVFAASSRLNAMRRDALKKLEALMRERVRRTLPDTPVKTYEKVKPQGKLITAEFYSAAEIPEEAYEYFDMIFTSDTRRVKVPAKAGLDLPPWCADPSRIEKLISDFAACGGKYVLCHTQGQVYAVKRAGLSPVASMRLNISCGDAARALAESGAERIILTPELGVPAVRDIVREIPTAGAVVYGKIPLMLMRRCIMSDRGCSGRCGGDGCLLPTSLSDRKGVKLSIYPMGDRVNVILNPHVIYMADKQAELAAAGLWHFIFADESAEAVRRIISAYRVGMSADACGITAFKRL